MSRSWYQIRAAARPRTAEIYLYGEIGEFGVTAFDFVRDFKALGRLDEVTVRINSPGGECVQGIAIYNVLKGSPAKVVVVIDGIAASMASVVAMAGDRVLMPENALMMIHDPIGLVVGTSRDMRDTADVIDKFGESLLTAYTSKTGLSADRIKEMMRAETWMNANEAVAQKFADEVVAPVAIAARFDLSRFHNPPRAQGGQSIAPRSPHQPADEMPRADAAEIAKLCADGGVPAMASTLLARGASVEEARAQIAAASAKPAAASPYDLAAAAGLPADSLVKDMHARQGWREAVDRQNRLVGARGAATAQASMRRQIERAGLTPDDWR